MMENFGFLILVFMLGWNNMFDITKSKEILMKAIIDKNYENLSELVGSSMDDTRKAIDALRDIITQLAEEKGISVEELIDNLNK